MAEMMTWICCIDILSPMKVNGDSMIIGWLNNWVMWIALTVMKKSHKYMLVEFFSIKIPVKLSQSVGSQLTIYLRKIIYVL
jgi:hypothetical protein